MILLGMHFFRNFQCFGTQQLTNYIVYFNWNLMAVLQLLCPVPMSLLRWQSTSFNINLPKSWCLSCVHGCLIVTVGNRSVFEIRAFSSNPLKCVFLPLPPGKWISAHGPLGVGDFWTLSWHVPCVCLSSVLLPWSTGIGYCFLRLWIILVFVTGHFRM